MRSRLGLWLTRKLDTHTPAKKLSPHQRWDICVKCVVNQDVNVNARRGILWRGFGLIPNTHPFIVKNVSVR